MQIETMTMTMMPVVDVARWQAFTGKQATLEATGEPFPLTPTHP